MADDTRLIPVSGPDIEDFRELASRIDPASERYSPAKATMHHAALLRSLADSYEAGIDEQQRALAAHCVEAHAAFAPEHELEPLRQLRDALAEPQSGEKR